MDTELVDTFTPTPVWIGRLKQGVKFCCVPATSFVKNNKPEQR